MKTNLNILYIDYSKCHTDIKTYISNLNIWDKIMMSDLVFVIDLERQNFFILKNRWGVSIRWTY